MFILAYIIYRHQYESKSPPSVFCAYDDIEIARRTVAELNAQIGPDDRAFIGFELDERLPIRVHVTVQQGTVGG